MPITESATRRNVMASQLFATWIFVFTEVMFFLALVSSYLVIRSREAVSWKPPADITLPVLATSFNTAVLIFSGLLFYAAVRQHGSDDVAQQKRAQKSLFQSIALGSFFVLFQGYEWVKLVSYGMTMSNSIFGATFFLLIGSHGLHAAAAILAMIWVYRRMLNGNLPIDTLKAMFLFWGFVVVIWPFLFGLVYF